ncbi:MAG: EVE domain-containing protein [Xanthomonadales bacterium]|nr:EVE domain-containing protein [Xanthomonadales bacterium]
MSSDSNPARYWLLKSEPDVFSIDDLKRKQREGWDGVRNYQARNSLRDEMRPGDLVIFYHSSCAQPAAVGLARVDSEAQPDPTQFDPASDYHDPKSSPEDPRWWLRQIAYVHRFEQPVTLQAMKQWEDDLDFPLLRRGNRLSVMPVPAAAARRILRDAGLKPDQWMSS